MSDSTEKKERRGTHRIPANKLPNILKTLILEFSEGQKYIVNTIDAGPGGISLLLPLPVFSIKDFNVTLQPQDNSFKIVDEIVYIKPVDRESSRVSIKFSSSNDLTKYNELLNMNNQLDKDELMMSLQETLILLGIFFQQ